MAGLLGAFNIDMDEIEAPSFDVKDDVWEYVVGDMYLLEGTSNHPDKSWIIIEFQLGDEGKTKSEWFQMPMDSDNKTAKEIEKLGYFKLRLKDLGVPDEKLNTVEPDDVIGKRGTLQTVTKGGYQNIKNVTLAEEEAAPVAATPVRRKAAAKPVAEAAPVAEESDTSEEETEEETVPAPVAKVPAKAAAAGVRKNPFAPK